MQLCISVTTMHDEHWNSNQYQVSTIVRECYIGSSGSISILITGWGPTCMSSKLNSLQTLQFHAKLIQASQSCMHVFGWKEVFLETCLQLQAPANGLLTSEHQCMKPKVVVLSPTKVHPKQVVVSRASCITLYKLISRCSQSKHSFLLCLHGS